MHLVKLLSLSLLGTLVASHSFLTDPDAYNLVFQPRDCEGRECRQACPSIPEDPRNTPESPARIWQRGQNVTIRWAKNNHISGFVRFALVPVRRMMKRYWHRRLSVYDGCWAQGVYNCTGELCGSDRKRLGFHRVVHIPPVFPDGDYVFGMVWYGGVRMAGEDFFSDYWSCSYVRIDGGEPVGGRYRAFFETGDTLRQREKDLGMCFSAIDAPGLCTKDGCNGPADYMVPRRHRWKRGPQDFGVGDVLNAMGVVHRARSSPTIVLEASPVEDAKVTPDESSVHLLQ